MDTQFHVTGIILWYATLALATITVVIILLMMRLIINRHFLKTRKTAWLEITPPAHTARTPEATEQLFSVIHGSLAARPLKERLLKRLPVMSFEIISTHQRGIRYLLQVDAEKSLNMQKTITAYIP